MLQIIRTKRTHLICADCGQRLQIQILKSITTMGAQFESRMLRWHVRVTSQSRSRTNFTGHKKEAPLSRGQVTSAWVMPRYFFFFARGSATGVTLTSFIASARNAASGSASSIFARLVAFHE